MSRSFLPPGFFAAAALLLAAPAAAPPFERAGIVDFYREPGDDDPVAARLYLEERHLENLDRLARDLEACAVSRGATHAASSPASCRWTTRRPLSS